MNLLCGELDAYKFVKPGKLNNTQLKLIIEDINKPQYIVCESSGKTLLLETLSEYLNIPIQIIDTTQLTVPGYKGTDIDEFLSLLLVFLFVFIF